MITSQSLGELGKSLAAAQGELEDASKSSENPHFKSRYADLAEVLQTIRPVLSKHGLSIIQTPGLYSKETGCVEVTTRLLHSSGEYIQDTLLVPVGQPNAQGVGGAVTYGRRYGAAAIVGISQEDDDGETAVARGRGGKSRSDGAKATAPSPPQAHPDTLIAGFQAAKTMEDVRGLSKAFASLSAEDQARVLPHAKAARERVS